MKVPFSYLDRQWNAAETDHILENIRALVRTGDFTLGAPVREFEDRVKVALGIQHVIGTNSGTEALILALKAFGIGPGDEVITQANTFYATAGAIVAVGATPVFVDVDETYSIDPACIETAITPRTKALIPVWWTGLAPDWTRIMETAVRHALIVIEDACPAFGAEYGSLSPGWFGHAAAFSLHPLKQLHVWGDGGIVVTRDEAKGRWLALYRNHGLQTRDQLAVWGVNARLQSIQAVVALYEWWHIAGAIARRNQIATLLDIRLADVPGVILPPRPLHRKQAFQIYVIQADRRDALLQHLRDSSVDAKIHYPTPLHLQPPGRALGYSEGSCPVAEAQAGRILSLPCNQFLTDDEVIYMGDRVREFYGR